MGREARLSSVAKWSQLTAALLEMRQNVLTLEKRIDALEASSKQVRGYDINGPIIRIDHVQS